MQLIGRKKLACLQGRDHEIDKWLKLWMAEVAQARWTQAAQLFHQYPSAYEQERGIFVFRVAKATEAIETKIAFDRGIALIVGLTNYVEVNGHQGN